VDVDVHALVTSVLDELLHPPAVDIRRERPEPLPGELLSPASEMAALLQRYQNDLAERRAADQAALADAHSAAADQAVLVFHLAAVLGRDETVFAGAGLTRVHRQLNALRNQMAQAIERSGLRVVDPTGQAFDEVADLVHVIGWRHGPEFAGEVVAETIEPIVCHETELVRPGRVVMGSPDKESM
jgi:hypothetical protein